jgi:rhomboid protease GluP
MEEPALRITPDMLLSRRLDLERHMPRVPPVTVGLIVLLTAILAAEMARGSLGSEYGIVRAGALVRQLVVDGQWWRLVTMMFLHGGVEHLFGNAVALWVLGMICEHAFGRAQFVFLFVMSGVAGALVSALLGPGPSVGASGAIFGLQGAAVVLLTRHRGRLIMRARRVGVVLVAWAVYTIAQGLGTPYVDNGAHIGGFLGGILIARGLHPLVLEPAPDDVRARIRRRAIFAIAVVAAAAIGWVVS